MVILGVLTLTLLGCKNDDDPDPRQAFDATFETDDFDVLFSASTSPGDSLFTLTTNPEIEFDIDNDLKDDEMEMGLKEFVKEVMDQTIGSLASATFSVSFDEQPVVEISGGEFNLDDFEFETLVKTTSDAEIYSCDISGEGELVGDEITFDFVLKLYITPTAYYQFEGTVVAQKN